jgi:hypothetical protein
MGDCIPIITNYHQRKEKNMKKLMLAICILALFAFAGCQSGLKTGFVYCCTPQADGTKKCVQMGQGDCKNTAGASIVNSCSDCR